MDKQTRNEDMVLFEYTQINGDIWRHTIYASRRHGFKSASGLYRNGQILEDTREVHCSPKFDYLKMLIVKHMDSLSLTRFTEKNI